MLLLEGYRPDLQAQIKTQYQISPSLLFYNVSTIVFLFILTICVCSLEIWQIGMFVWTHDTLAFDLMIHGCLGVFGDIFIYRLLLVHRQHVVPLVITIRRISTSVVNLLYFHHDVSVGQTVGIGIVCLGVGI